jgi:non-specific serine/threonine protein kinase/serine/threonine-protein kinase
VTDHDRLSELFLAACNLPVEERAAFLGRVCGDDAVLRAELEAMLAQDAQVDATLVLEAPVVAATHTPSGSQIGPYRLLHKIGEGGMGEVWLAEQLEPVKRNVALKIIKAGMDTRQVVARFEAERQALAMMDHPAIAKVFDAGTTPEGRPYFVMEHIQGVPITEHCDANRSTTQERIEIFVQVCEGVQHAHQKAIIHRDLKPSNVLVTIHDGRPLPKIIDFGVAKATSQRLTEKTMFTEMGALIGTPEYMSPEQAQLTGEDIDTRTDIYALGVILYELLAGALPFDSRELRRAGFAEIVRRICEDEPQVPSARVSTLGEHMTQAAAHRRVDIRTLRSQLRGDLDWITMKALEKDRSRRYGSPAEMSADLVRHLHDEPVLAGAPSLGYRARKFARRHRIAVTFVAMIALALALGIIGTTLGLIRARRAETTARREAAISERVATFMSNALGGVDANRAGRMIVDDLKTRAAEQGMDRALDEALSKLSGTDTARRLLREEILGRAAKNVEAELPQDPLIAAGLEHTIALTFDRLGFADDAAPYELRAMATRDRLLGPTDKETLRSSEIMGKIRFDQGRFVEAESVHRRTLESRTRSLGPEHPETLRSMTYLAWVLRQMTRYDDAEKLYNDTLAIHRRVLGPEDPQTLTVMNDLGVLYQKQDRWEDAMRLHRANLETNTRVLGPEHPLTFASRYNLAFACASLEQWDEASVLFTRCLDVQRRALGRDHPETIWTTLKLAIVASGQGRFQEARKVSLEAIDAWPRVFGATHSQILYAQGHAAYADYMLGDLQEARRILEPGFAAHRRGESAGDDAARHAFRILVAIYRAGGWIEQARTLERDMLPVWRQIIENGGEDSQVAHLGIALALLDEGHGSRADAEQALREAERSAELMPKPHGRPSRQSSALAAQALAHHLLGHRSEAEQLQRKAIADLLPGEKALRVRFEADLARYVAATR